MSIAFANLLLKEYSKKSEKEIVDLVESIDFHIVPSMNPDGFERATEGKCEGGDLTSGRTNSNNKDLNRNFPTWNDLVS